NVTKENMAYYYQEEHNKKYSYKVKVGYNRKYGTSDASVIEDIFHKQYNIPWCELPKAIDIALDVYTDVEHSPNYNNRLTPYMMYNNNTMMEKLMRQVKKELDNPNSLYGKSQNEIDAIKQRKKESRNKHMEKVRYMQGINKKIKAGTATQEEINNYNENDENKQRKKETRNKNTEKVRYMQVINKKIKAGTATQEEINYYNENAY